MSRSLFPIFNDSTHSTNCSYSWSLTSFSQPYAITESVSTSHLNEFNSLQGNNHPSSRASLFQAQLHYTTRAIFSKMPIWLCYSSTQKTSTAFYCAFKAQNHYPISISHWSSHPLHTVAEVNRGKQYKSLSTLLAKKDTY